VSVLFNWRGLALLMLLGAAPLGAEPVAPYSLAPGVLAENEPDLGLEPPEGARTFPVFKPTDSTDKFSNGVVLIAFRGRLYAQWQSSPKDEDSADTWVAYSISDDGEHWSEPLVLAKPGSSGGSGRMHSSGGWWTDGKQLVAYINVWSTGFQSGDGGFTEYLLSKDGKRWSDPRRLMRADGKPVEGIIEQDPHVLPGGRVVTAFHTRPGMIVQPFFTDDPLTLRGWMPGAITLLPNDGKMSRELEPSLFIRGDCVVMVFRDQASSFRQLASESCDRGATWGTPVLTNMPDSRAKQSAGNLPDGRAFLVNAPRGDRVRIPLAVTVSADGRLFDRAWLLRGEKDLQPRRYEGQYKRPGYHYPKSLVWNDHLYVAYATNKEDVEITRVPIAALK